jgi:hypothetical protein
MQIYNCQYGFYTCSFIGQVDFCNNCEKGQNYQFNENIKQNTMKQFNTIMKAEQIKRPVGRPKGPEKVYIGFKIEPKYHSEVKAMVKEFIRIQNSLLTLNKQ